MAVLPQELNASLGLHLGLEHYVALTSAGTEHPAARRFAGHVAEGKQWLELEVTRVAWWLKAERSLYPERSLSRRACERKHLLNQEHHLWVAV